MNASTSLVTVNPTTASASVPAQLVAALLLGLVMLYAVGFSEASVAHNAAHDVRHATGRPCH
ncbi:MAG: CbtB domain-containing protein [Pseudomonadota bacterium]|jgi:cobalt transporter subunit CbtB|uniref:CbtB domain-containing protein n=1 Tax=Polaromonas sp. TaxID=1869339 RepID=UPI000C06378C|nr:CbtB domain-containing protein [Polaromonas sp.]MDP2451644.1 CbtB domain-containing protein [Polaromonas sp.]MDP3829509.1 CbtB domain-containing protein [Polaromonas sp.]MEA3395301.1 CbtB domain-containing protein [Pseudomonadota bacterium]PHM19358.1 MAG: cobalt transporter [Curvibacter sp. PD_MW3]